MKTATFDPKGGPIQVSIACNPKRDGSYDVILYEANQNKVVKEWSGNFLNTDDDEYDLPKPNTKNDGRLLEGMIVLAVPGGAGPSTATMIVAQDGKTLAKEEGQAAPGGASLVDLFVKLVRA